MEGKRPISDIQGKEVCGRRCSGDQNNFVHFAFEGQVT